VCTAAKRRYRRRLDNRGVLRSRYNSPVIYQTENKEDNGVKSQHKGLTMRGIWDDWCGSGEEFVWEVEGGSNPRIKEKRFYESSNTGSQTGYRRQSTKVAAPSDFGAA